MRSWTEDRCFDQKSSNWKVLDEDDKTICAIKSGKGAEDDLCDYNQKLYDDAFVNRLDKAISLFEEMIHSPWFTRAWY
jgi:hypothetical protein